MYCLQKKTKTVYSVSPSANSIPQNNAFYHKMVSQRDHNLLLSRVQSIPISVKECAFGSLLISTFSHFSLTASYRKLQELNLFKSQLQIVGKQNNYLPITKGRTTQTEASRLVQ